MSRIVKNPVAKLFQRHSGSRAQRTVGILGLPFWRGQPKRGTELAPGELRKRGLLEAIEKVSASVSAFDFGDVNFDGCGDFDGQRFMAESAKLMRKSVTSSLERCSVLVNIGGDHSVGMATVAGHADFAQSLGKDVAVLWVDAHSDINTPSTSPSGSWHGMPLSFVLHQMTKYLPRLREFSGWTSTVSAESIAFIGLRDVDPYERFFLDKLHITSFSIRDVDSLGMKQVAEMALQAVNPRGDKSLHVSFDIDALDPTQARSTGTPVAGGLTLREAAVLAETVVSTQTLRVLDMVEVNPRLGSPADVESTMDAAQKVVTWMLGHRREGRQPDQLSDEIRLKASDSSSD